MTSVKHTTAVRFIISLAALSLILATVQTTRAQLNSSRARGALRRMAGIELTNGAVRVKTITDASKTTANVTAELRTVFRLEQNVAGHWRVAEVRVAPDRWEDVALLGSALSTHLPVDECNTPGFQLGRKAPIEPTPKRARCLLGSLLGIAVPSDAVRIQEIAPSPVPLASKPSATVVAWIGVEARAVNEAKGWRISEIRTGNRDWVNLEQVATALNQQKQNKARVELEMMARALEKYRVDRGAYVVGDTHALAIDHLSPKYLLPVVRVDPWNQPYHYKGTRENYVLSSAGPDEKINTNDDINLSGPAR